MSPPSRLRKVKLIASSFALAFTSFISCVDADARARLARERWHGRESTSARSTRARSTPSLAIVSLVPHRAHVSGGTTITIRGSGFDAQPGMFCRFFLPGGAFEVEATRARVETSSEASCASPSLDRGVRSATAHVTLTTDVEGNHWTASPGDFTRGFGTSFAAFEYDSSAPGCYGCVANAGATAVASRARERWTSDVTRGAVTGGSKVRVKSALASGQELGTFYPGVNLRCSFWCPKVVGGVGEGYARGGFPEDPSDGVTWVAYDEIECVTPYWPGAGDVCSDGTTCASATCVVRVSNDGDTFDDLVAGGGDGDGAEAFMPNAAYVLFTYDLAKTAPVVTAVTTTRAPSGSTRTARGPFAGGTVARVAGSGFYQGTGLVCAFEDNANGSTRRTIVEGTYVSATTIECVSPRRNVSGVEIDDVSGAPCFSSTVSVSNTGSGADAVWSATTSSSLFYFCDMYVRGDGPQNGDGSVLRPFRTIQAAIDSSLASPRPVGELRASTALYDASHGWLNTDVIRLYPGVYRGHGNTMLTSRDSDVDITPLNDAAVGRTVVDCENARQLYAHQTQSTQQRMGGANILELGGLGDGFSGFIRFDDRIIVLSCPRSRASRTVEACVVDAATGESQCRFEKLL